jgi:hypothetical protein
VSLTCGPCKLRVVVSLRKVAFCLLASHAFYLLHMENEKKSRYTGKYKWTLLQDTIVETGHKTLLLLHRYSDITVATGSDGQA